MQREGGREGGGEGELSGDGYQHGLWASGTLSVSPGKEDSVNEMHISKLKNIFFFANILVVYYSLNKILSKMSSSLIMI